MVNKNLLKIVKNFCQNSSIDGLQNVIIGKKHKKIWLLLLVITTSYCMFQCIGNIKSYLNFDVSTRTTEKYLPNTIFPAITFCPQYIHKKSKYGNQADVSGALAFYYADSLQDVNELLKQNKRTCDNHNNLTNDMKEKETTDFNDKVKNGSVWETNEYFVNFQEYLTKCFWNNKSFKCSNAFLNHISDVGECFTFNPGLESVHGIIDSQIGNGINITNYDESHYKNDGRTNSLRLFININQSEYCGNGLTKRGAGYFFRVHEINRNPSFLLSPSTLMNPGYDINIVMTPIVYDRQTENLGKCTNFVDLYLFSNSGKYILERCYLQCTSELILKTCNCYPPTLGGFRKAILLHSTPFSINNYADVCLGASFTCMKQWMHDILGNTSINSLCPYCKQPCYETKYEFDLTYLRMSERNLKLNYFNNITLEDFLKNYIFVKFSMKNNKVQYIEERQKFTLRDLFIFVGGNIGLYLGMSFMTLFEIIQFILELIDYFCKHCKENRNLQKVRIKKIKIKTIVIKTNDKSLRRMSSETLQSRQSNDGVEKIHKCAKTEDD